MRLLMLTLTLVLLAEIRADVNGEATVIGCFLRVLGAADDGRCRSSQQRGRE